MKACCIKVASLAVPAAVAALALAACGGSSHSSQSRLSGHSGETTAANAARYPECMRTHGVTNFPDAQVSGNSVKLTINPSITGSPAYNSARQACAHLMPTGAGQITLNPAQQQAHEAGLLAFATCVRKHGFPRFPDPNSQGQLTPAMIAQAGINLRQPAVLQAGDACAPASHGQITKGDVARAISDAGASGS